MDSISIILMNIITRVRMYPQMDLKIDGVIRKKSERILKTRPFFQLQVNLGVAQLPSCKCNSYSVPRVQGNEICILGRNLNNKLLELCTNDRASDGRNKTGLIETNPIP